VTYPAVVLPGWRGTADRYNAGFAIGTLVFAAYRDAAQNMSAGQTVGAAADALSWDNVELDLLGGWSAATPTRFTPTIAGRYQCAGGVGFQASGSGNVRGCSWRQTGNLTAAATFRNIYNTIPASPIPVFNASTLGIVFNGSSDYVELCPFQDGAGALGTATGSNRPYINITYVGSQ
jgi:hypothetical protein